jgi:hypothetical protein
MKFIYTTGGFLFGSVAKAFKKYQSENPKNRSGFQYELYHQFCASPDNKWVAFTELYKVYMAPMPKTGQPIGLSAKTKASSCCTSGKRCRYQSALVC